MKVVRKDLEDGVKLPTDTYLKVFHSLHDPVKFDKFRINLQRFKTSSGANIDVQLMDSDIHVFTRLNLRPDTTPLQGQSTGCFFTNCN
jgi:carboxylesterase